MHSVALSSELHHEVCTHLIRLDGQEDLCFVLWYPSCGKNRMTALLQRVVLPIHGDRAVHGNVEFYPSYFERVISLALQTDAGIAFLHSHPSSGWQDMSKDDIRAEQLLAPRVFAVTGLPLVGLTVGNDGVWSARFWDQTKDRGYQCQWCHSVRVVGDRLMCSYAEDLVPRPTFSSELTRTVSAWGENMQARLARLRVGIVGAGSVGSMVAEALARTGISTIYLIDFDSIEAVNRDRHLHALPIDVAKKRSKTLVVSRAIEKSATAKGFRVIPLEYSIVEEEGFRNALDCDVLFSCVDRPWPRQVLNFIAFAHLIPVIDGGVLVRTAGSNLLNADMGAHIAAPGRACLECVGQYNSGDVATERDGYLDDPSYIVNMTQNHHLRANENVFGFSMATASLEIMQFLSFVVAPQQITDVGTQKLHFVTGNLDQNWATCGDNCLFSTLTAKGDRSGIVVTTDHPRAQEVRKSRKRSAIWQLIDGIKYRIGRYF